MPATDAAGPSSAAAYRKLFPGEFFDSFISQGIRPDGRKLQEPRQVLVQTGLVSTARASGSAHIGNSYAVAGVTLTPAKPTDDAPDEGTAAAKVTITSLAAAESHYSEANALGATLSHALTKHLFSKHVVNLEQLCIESGKHCWHVGLDVYVLNNDGSALDACMAAAVATLQCLEVPVGKPDPESGKIEVEKDGENEVSKPFELLCAPMCLTVGMYKSQYVVDPTHEEEQILTSTASVVVRDADTLLGVYAASAVELSPTLIAQLASTAAAREPVRVAQRAGQR